MTIRVQRKQYSREEEVMSYVGGITGDAYVDDRRRNKEKYLGGDVSIVRRWFKTKLTKSITTMELF